MYVSNYISLIQIILHIELGRKLQLFIIHIIWPIYDMGHILWVIECQILSHVNVYSWNS